MTQPASPRPEHLDQTSNLGDVSSQSGFKTYCLWLPLKENISHLFDPRPSYRTVTSWFYSAPIRRAEICLVFFEDGIRFTAPHSSARPYSRISG